jgi:hypothetical protein
MLHYDKDLKPVSQSLRRCATDAEKIELSMIKKISPLPSLLKRGNKEMPTKFSDEPKKG